MKLTHYLPILTLTALPLLAHADYIGHWRCISQSGPNKATIHWQLNPEGELQLSAQLQAVTSRNKISIHYQSEGRWQVKAGQLLLNDQINQSSGTMRYPTPQGNTQIQLTQTALAENHYQEGAIRNALFTIEQYTPNKSLRLSQARTQWLCLTEP